MAWMITNSGPIAINGTFTYRPVGEASSLWASAKLTATTLTKSINGTDFTGSDSAFGAGQTPHYVTSAPVLKFTAPGVGVETGVSIAEWVRDPA